MNVPDHCPECGSTERNYALGVCELSANVWHGKSPQVPKPEPAASPSAEAVHEALQQVNALAAANGKVVVGWTHFRCKRCDRLIPIRQWKDDHDCPD